MMTAERAWATAARDQDLDRSLSYMAVILDYIRHYGESAIGGVHFVGGITKLGSEAAMSVLDPAFLELVPGFFATDVEESVRSIESLLRRCFVQEPSAADLYLMLGYNSPSRPTSARHYSLAHSTTMIYSQRSASLS